MDQQTDGKFAHRLGGPGSTALSDLSMRDGANVPRDLILAAAALLIAAMLLWIDFCRFPESSWNDIRLLPTFMAAAGEPVYSLPGQGVVTTWMYGPVPLWFWMPSVLASDPISAVSIAGLVNILSTIAALSATCLFWPGIKAGLPVRLMALALAFVVWPEHGFRFLQADNVAVVLALAANLLLVTGGSRPGVTRGWLAAAATAGFLGCKQTAVGILAAQLVWLVLDRGRMAALGHLARTAVAGGVLAAATVLEFGWREFWFGFVTIPLALPSAPDPVGRLLALAPILAVQWGIPLIAVVMIGRRLLHSSHPLRLPLFVWVLCLPLDLAGLLTAGGSINNLHGFQLTIAPLFILLISLATRISHTRKLALSAAVVAIIALARIGSMEQAPFKPSTENMNAAMEIERSLFERVWLPWNPLVSYFAEGRFYHCEDGLYVRKLTGFPVPKQQVIAHLPSRFSAIAYRTPRIDWGVADEFEGAPARSYDFHNWQVVVWPEAAIKDHD